MRIHVKRLSALLICAGLLTFAIGYWSTKTIVSFKKEVSTAAFENNDLGHCSITTDKHSIVASLVQQLRIFVPHSMKFDKNYQNPCWHAKLSFSEQDNVLLQENTTELNSMLSNDTLSNLALRSHSKFGSKLSAKAPTLVCLPAVFLAAFPKSGTTSLYKLIVKHPGVTAPNLKESHFWSTFLRKGNSINSNQKSSILWYLSQFSDSSRQIEKHPYMITIDGSVDTLWASETFSLASEQDTCIYPLVMFQIIPSAKFIIMMRDPVSRLFSDYWYFCSNHHWREGDIIEVPNEIMRHAPMIFHNISIMAIQSFHDCLKNHSQYECTKQATVGYRDRSSHLRSCFPLRLGIGLYYFHIVKWLRVYPREQFLFLQAEDLLSHPFSVLDHVWAFLGLDSIPKTFVQNIIKEKSNEMLWIKSKKYKEHFVMLPETFTALKKFYEPYNRKLAILLGDSQFLWDASGMSG